MKISMVAAKAITAISLSMAKKACGAASYYGLYQPKEPKIEVKASK